MGTALPFGTVSADTIAIRPDGVVGNTVRMGTRMEIFGHSAPLVRISEQAGTTSGTAFRCRCFEGRCSSGERLSFATRVKFGLVRPVLTGLP